MKKLSGLVLLFSFCFCGCSSNETSSSVDGTRDRVAQSSTSSDPDNAPSIGQRNPVGDDGVADDSRSRRSPDRTKRGALDSEKRPARQPRKRERRTGDRDTKREREGTGESDDRDRMARGNQPSERETLAMVAAFPDSMATVGLGEGDLVPEIAGEDIEGTPFKLSDYQGKVIMLDFWGDW